MTVHFATEARSFQWWRNRPSTS